MVTRASRPFRSFTVASPTSATSSAGSKRMPYTNVRFAMPDCMPRKGKRATRRKGTKESGRPRTTKEFTQGAWAWSELTAPRPAYSAATADQLTTSHQPLSAAHCTSIPVANAASVRQSSARADETQIAQRAGQRSVRSCIHPQLSDPAQFAPPPSGIGPREPHLPPLLPSSPQYVSWERPERESVPVDAGLQRRRCVRLRVLSWTAPRRE